VGGENGADRFNPKLDRRAGRETDRRSRDHYVQEGGRFKQACASYLAGDTTTVLFQDSRFLGGSGEGERERLRKAASKTRYTCGCQIAWARPGARLICGNCNGRMEICFES
jgi:hypothetical protein